MVDGILIPDGAGAPQIARAGGNPVEETLGFIMGQWHSDGREQSVPEPEAVTAGESWDKIISPIEELKRLDPFAARPLMNVR